MILKCGLMNLKCCVYDFERLFNDFEMLFNDLSSSLNKFGSLNKLQRGAAAFVFFWVPKILRTAALNHSKNISKSLHSL